MERDSCNSAAALTFTFSQKRVKNFSQLRVTFVNLLFQCVEAVLIVLFRLYCIVVLICTFFLVQVQYVRLFLHLRSASVDVGREG